MDLGFVQLNNHFAFPCLGNQVAQKKKLHDLITADTLFTLYTIREMFLMCIFWQHSWGFDRPSLQSQSQVFLQRSMLQTLQPCKLWRFNAVALGNGKQPSAMTVSWYGTAHFQTPSQLKLKPEGINFHVDVSNVWTKLVDVSDVWTKLLAARWL